MSESNSSSSFCRCCHGEDCYKTLQDSYIYENQVEIYANMLRKTFGIDIWIPSCTASRAICEACITELRAATLFKTKVLQCERHFQKYLENVPFTTETIKEEIDTLGFIPEETFVKEEIRNSYDYHSDHNLEGTDYNDASELTQEVKKARAKRNTSKKKYKNVTTKNRTVKKIPKPKVDLEVVVQTESGEIYSCKECGGRYDVIGELKKHITDVHKDKVYSCKLCDYQTKNRYDYYYKHMETHNKKIRKCTFCEKSFDSRYLMKKHENEEHSKGDVYTCDECNKQFSFKILLKRHIMRHDDLNKKFMCETCGLRVENKARLKIHIMAVHEKIKRFECNICGKKFSSNHFLKCHLLNHNGIYPFTCKLCPEGYNKPSALKLHIDTVHLGKDKYNCKVCDETFNDRGKMKTHMQLHKGQIPYRCGLCNKDFKNKFTFNRHVLMKHTDDVDKTPFQCDVCDMKVASKQSLKKHKLRHEPNAQLKTKVRRKRPNVASFGLGVDSDFQMGLKMLQEALP